MIDANRLGHSLATALKDRPHGIPVQPNRSLPLRPPPPTPIRLSVSKSPKTSPTSLAPATQEAEGLRSGLIGTNITKDSTKKGNVRTDGIPSLGVVGMNFYDSKGEEEEEEDEGLNEKYTHGPSRLLSEGISNSRHAKSLDNFGSDESNCGEDKIRKSFEYEISSPDLYKEERNLSNFIGTEGHKSFGKISKRDKEERRGKKRKSSVGEDNPEISRKAKLSPRVKDSHDRHLGDNFKHNSLAENGNDPISKSKNLTSRVESSAVGLPTIFKYRNSESTSQHSVKKNRNSNTPDCTVDRFRRNQTGLTTYKRILPKPPANIPKCPAAIPIELAYAMNQGDLRNPNSNARIVCGNKVAVSQTGNLANSKSQKDSMRQKTNIEKIRTPVFETSEEDIENTLPSMPSLEDMMQTESLQENLTLHRNQDNLEKTDSNSGNVPMEPVVEARVLQIPEDMLSKTNGFDANHIIKENTNLTHDLNINKPNESIVNLTTVLEIQIPGRSPELIILQAPQTMANGQTDSMVNNSPVEATTPVSLSSSIQPALEEQTTFKEAKKTDTTNPLRGYRKQILSEYRTSQEEVLQENQSADIDSSSKSSPIVDDQSQCEDMLDKNEPQYTLKRKSPVEFEVQVKDSSGLPQTQELSDTPQEITKDSQVKPKVEDTKVKSKVRSRRNRLNLKLQKLYKEEAHLKRKISQTSDPSRLTRLQQKMNCAEKKIENTRKYLRLVGPENPGLHASPVVAPLRIKVRGDLVQKIQPPESVEPASQSPLQSTNETDDGSTEKIPPALPLVITISETDSASSGEETDSNDWKSPDNVKPQLQSDPGMKFTYQNITENKPSVDSVTDNSLPDAEMEEVALRLNPEMTNNNVEYFNKKLPLVPEPVLAMSTTAVSSPQIPTSQNTLSMSIPQVPTSGNTVTMSIPPLIRDPIDFSMDNSNSFVNQKSSPGAQYETPNSNLPPDKVDPDRSKLRCKCPRCLKNIALAVAAKNTAQIDTNNSISNAANDLRTPSAIQRTAIHENANVHPVPNYPVHRTDYRTTANVPSMFSRDNGGANINLSSPLQGHSALPLTPPYYRNLTAQGYTMPAEPSPNQQTSQWHTQQPPVGKSSVPYTPDQDSLANSSVLASYLLQTNIQDSAAFPSSMKLSSRPQSKEANGTHPTQPINERITNTEFPTFANWAAQMTRESTTARKPASNPVVDGTGYKTTGSDMYKMAATAVDSTNYPNAVSNTIRWAPGRPRPADHRGLSQGYPSQKTVPPQFYQRDYSTNPQMAQNPLTASARYPGNEVFVQYPTNSYHQAPPSAPQTTRSAELSTAQNSHGQQNSRQYQHQKIPTRPLPPGAGYQNQMNSRQVINPMGFMPQQYLQRPPSYVQAMLSQWQSANNYHNNYVSSQFSGGYNVQSKPIMEQNPTLYKSASKNLAPTQPQHNPAVRHLPQNVSNGKSRNPIYGMQSNLNPGIVQNVRGNVDSFDFGGSYIAPQLNKVHKSSDRSITLKCSTCGTPGPKFNCFGCEGAFYCNKHCQAEHWGKHYIECSRRMPKLKKVS